jgi:hypothetical protein
LFDRALVRIGRTTLGNRSRDYPANGQLRPHGSNMISIACTNCKAILTIDEAFVGGVCRCQHCGTIQTVPATTRGRNGPPQGNAISGQALGGSRQGATRDKPAQGTGLEDLADIVASSGLAGSGLSSRRLNRPTPTSRPAVGQTPDARVIRMIAIGASAGVVLLAGILFLTLSSDNPTAPGGAGPGGSGSAVVASKGPAFCGQTLTGNTVIYVLDRGSGSQDIIELMKIATLKSIASLGEERKFQVIFWDNGFDPVLFPPTGPTYATDKKLGECRKAMENVAALGQANPRSALEKAYAQDPDSIVLATGKGTDLTGEFLADFEAAREKKAIPTYTFNLGEGDSDVLKKAAQDSGGQYKHMTPSELDAFLR